MSPNSDSEEEVSFPRERDPEKDGRKSKPSSRRPEDLIRPRFTCPERPTREKSSEHKKKTISRDSSENDQFILQVQ